jgi:tetratricopeptide (TPR) repeat protein
MMTGFVRMAAGAVMLAGMLAAQPKVKSKAEAEAIMAVQNAATLDARLAAIDNMLVKFADTEFKPVLLQMATGIAQQMGDYEKTIIYGERTLEADPKNYTAMITLANTIAQRTKEFDLDREEKLGRAEKLANGAMEILKTAQKPRPDIPDEQWEAAKTDLAAQAHQALAFGAMARKKFDVAISEFKTAAEMANPPDPATWVRLADAYNQAQKPDEAIATIDKVLAMPDLNPQVKSVAESVKATATRLKAAKQ